MSKDLILITRQFPYGGNETFLESEIPILSRHFGRIRIYPYTKAATRRETPANVSVHDDICDAYAEGRKWMFRTLASPFFYKTLVKYFPHLHRKRVITGLFKYSVSYKIYLDFAKNLFSREQRILVYSYWYTQAVHALLAAKDEGSKVVSRVHGGDLYEKTSYIGLFPYRKDRIAGIDRIYSISEDGQRYLRSTYGIDNVRVSRLGTADPYTLNRADPVSLDIVSVSNIIPVKRVDFMARCIQAFARMHPGVQVSWNHFGDGTDRQKVTDIARTEAPPNLRVTFHGRIPNQDVFAYYRTNPVNLFINLSLSEGIPVSIMEAISFGIPVLATDVGGTAEVVNPATGVLLAKEPGLDEVTGAIGRLFQTPPARAATRDFWARNYSAETNFSAFAADLQELNPEQ